MQVVPAALALVASAALLAQPAFAAETAAVEPMPSLNLTEYAGTWYQVAWFPNRFQRQCTSDTQAEYRLLPDGTVEVENRCRRADGAIESVVGLARPSDAVRHGPELRPATLEVTFVPPVLRWLPFVWAPYWVLQLAPDGRYSVVGEPGREYLWVLSRTPSLSATDESAIRSKLQLQGYDLARWQSHPHTAPAR